MTARGLTGDMAGAFAGDGKIAKFAAYEGGLGEGCENVVRW